MTFPPWILFPEISEQVNDDMDVKDDAQNVEMEDIEDESSEGNNSWDIVVSKATYIFPTVLKVSNPPFFFSHTILLHFPTHSSLSRLQQTTKQTPSIKILLIKTKNKKHKTKVTRKSQHFPSLHFGRNQPHHGQRVLILCRKQVLACNNPCSESSILVQQLKVTKWKSRT
ncbi:hypothetical protein QL285_037809 [Trifolium repens]|nr:hypothetical protein QL285_037809 [Trifolium repens]